MKSNILALSLLSLISAPTFAATDVTRVCCKKTTCAPTVITSAQTIDVSGPYCLGRNIVGTIVIDADNVTLDLNSHEIDGDGALAAVVSVGNFNTVIHNGSVKNAGGLGISLTGCRSAHVENVNVYDSNNAIALTSCSNSSVSDVNAFNNFNTSGAIILVSNCNNIGLTNIFANNNVKEFPVATGTTNEGIGIVTIFDSYNINLQDSSINNNTRNNSNVRLAPLFVYLSENVNVTNVQANSNSVGADTRGLVPLHIRQSESVVLEGCTANGNTADTTTNIFRPIYALDTLNFVVNDCQINDNVLGSTLPSPASAFVDLSCIYTFYAVTFVNNDNIITNCQIAGNQIGSVGTLVGTSLTGIYVNAFSVGPDLGAPDLVGRSVISHCQINDNVINNPGTTQSISTGINISQALDVIVDSCSVNNNSGGSNTVNIYVNGVPNPDSGLGVPVANVTISNCIANNSVATQFSAGIILTGGFDAGSGLKALAQNCQIVNCQANNNSSLAGTNGDGIVVGDAIGCAIINCQAHANGNTGIKLGVVTPQIDPAPLTDNINITGCTAHGNGSFGFQVAPEGQTTNCLIQDCVALANGGAGFIHANPTFTSRYLGNYAKDNVGINYDISGGAIQIFTLDNLGIYTNVSGDAVHFSELINIDGNTF